MLAKLPSWLWDGETLPVPVEHVADSGHGLLIRDVADLSTAPGAPQGSHLSGLLLSDRGEIWVNAGEAREWPPRRRFTIGHELGHWCLHRANGAVWCRARTVDPDEPVEPSVRHPYPPEESEANEFAATLLMPAHLIARHYARLRERDPNTAFPELCRLFGTSGAAMSRRLRRVV